MARVTIRTILARLGIVRDDLTPLEADLIRLAAYPPEDQSEPILFETHHKEPDDDE